MQIIVGIILILISALLGASGALFLKKASSEISFKLSKIITNKYLILGVMAYGISKVVGLPVYKYLELSLLYPFIATGYIWTCIFSVYFLKEKMNLWKWTGITFIIIGISIIGVGN